MNQLCNVCLESLSELSYEKGASLQPIELPESYKQVDKRNKTALCLVL